MSTKIWVIGGLAVAALVGAGVVGASMLDRPAQPAASASPSAPAPAAPAPGAPPPAALAQAPAAPGQVDPLFSERVLGRPDAPIEIIEYSSLTCPHCANFHASILPTLKREYIDTGRVRIVYRDFPFDRAALGAAMAARCMPPERYFAFLDVLFASQGQWATAQDPAGPLQQTARMAGMSQAQFDACLQNQQLADFILQRRMEAEQRFQVRSTPTFIINGGAERIVGAQPIEQFRQVLDRLAPAPRG